MNNRSSGRRRGRGGRSGSNRGPNDGNRLDNRARGNANQLLEKYKGLARDAHQQGDRVMNEYYLQFADHYFRILAEANQRKEDQQRDRDEGRKARNGSDSSDDDDDDEEEIEAEAPKKPRRTRRSKDADKAEETNGAGNGDDDHRIDADRLPGSLALDHANGDGDDERNGKPARKPATRSRRKTGSDDGEAIAAEA